MGFALRRGLRVWFAGPRVGRQRVAAVSSAAAAGAAFAGCVTVGSSNASCAPPAAQGEQRRVKVLVTGFNDWKNLGETPNLWRCRDNPSCRLLVGAACDSPPLTKQGGLARRLRRCTAGLGVEIDWQFQTLTTQWQTAATLDHLAFDVVINIGLGVYDGSKELRVEQGAHNSARGVDAAGHRPRSSTQEESMRAVLEVESMTRITTAVNGLEIGEYKVVAVGARQSNSYICNDTHYRGASPDRPRRLTLSVHLPKQLACSNNVPLCSSPRVAALARWCRPVKSSLLHSYTTARSAVRRSERSRLRAPRFSYDYARPHVSASKFRYAA